jgi:hypothetical protein
MKEAVRAIEIAEKVYLPIRKDIVHHSEKTPGFSARREPTSTLRVDSRPSAAMTSIGIK